MARLAAGYSRRGFGDTEGHDRRDLGEHRGAAGRAEPAAPPAAPSRAPPAAPSRSPLDGRAALLLRWEIVAVFAVSLGASGVYALVSYIGSLTARQSLSKQTTG